jgi:pantoate--beta-alanine ligase
MRSFGANAAKSSRDATGLRTVRTVADLREAVRGWRREGHSVGLVPTMGAIHDGHLSLVRALLNRCDRIVVSLFVNPTQFGPNEDIATYPANEELDAARLASAGVDLLYAPCVAEMYPDGFATTVTVSGISAGLCGTFRPGHFAGVATVVSKLLLQAEPDIAIFGEKDYQQLQVVRRLVRDLDIPSSIVGVPTVRESDGLALSSRNAYLSPAERAIAPVLNRTLHRVAARLRAGDAAREAAEWGRRELAAAGFGPVDYLEVRDSDTLAPIEGALAPGRKARLLAAAFLGKTRLIDNIAAAADGEPASRHG